jgi:fatty-acid desaturase
VAWSSGNLQACLFAAVVVHTDFVAYWPLSVAWFGAFGLALSVLALGSVEVGFQHCCSHRHYCCRSWPSEEYGLIEISKRRGGGREMMIDQGIPTKIFI